MNTFGERLSYLIKKSDYKSVAQFAKDVGVSPVTLSNIKREVTDTSLGKVKLMVGLLRQHGVAVDYDWLIDGVDKENELAVFKKRTLEEAERLVKPFSNRISPRLPFPEYSLQNSVVFV